MAAIINSQRVEWVEVRNASDGVCERFFVIAQKVEGVWQFHERNSWEIRWVRVPESPALRRKLTAMLAARSA